MFNEIFSDLWKNYRGTSAGFFIRFVGRSYVSDPGLFADDLSFDLYHRRFLFR